MKSTNSGSKSQAPQPQPKTYEVGYKKPPEKNRFQPGKSGNPSGRQRKQPTPEESLARLMAMPVLVNENGVAKKMTRTEALIYKMFSAAMKGEVRAAETIMKILSKQAAKEATEPEPLNLAIYTMEELEQLEKILRKRDESIMNEEIKKVKRKFGVKDD